MTTSFLHWFVSYSSVYPHTSNSKLVSKTVRLFPSTERNCSVWHSVRTALTRCYAKWYSTNCSVHISEPFQSTYVKRNFIHIWLTEYSTFIFHLDKDDSHILCSPKFHFRVHSSLSIIPVLSQINPSALSNYISLRRSLMSPSPISLSLPSGFFPSGFPARTLYIFLLYLIHAKCPAHLIILQYLHTLGRLFQIANASCWTSGISTDSQFMGTYVAPADFIGLSEVWSWQQNYGEV
jgi:hypothetical protein